MEWMFNKIKYLIIVYGRVNGGLPDGSDGKEYACYVGDLGLIPGSRRSPGEGNGNLLQYSCLGNLMDTAAWWAPVHGVTRVGHDLVTKTTKV